MKKIFLAGLITLTLIVIGCAGARSAAKILDNPSAPGMQRRRAYITLLKTGKNTQQLLSRGLTDPDPLIRAKALYEYNARFGSAVFPELKRMSGEKDLSVLKQINGLLQSARSNPAARAARQDLQGALERLAAANTGAEDPNFPFRRENIRLKDRPDWDFDIVQIGKFMIPTENWLFFADKKADGHTRGFYQENIDVAGWMKVSASDWTRYKDCKDYMGIGWYRGSFSMPEKMPDAHAVELHFRGIDEDAWVFVNGKYVGAYLMGEKQAFQPFWLDATNEIRWNSENQITIRIRGARGGLTKPIDIEILK